ncbi:MAG: formylglycine-generating enzyme family protein [bacterium]|nr:formylglycine-generating enzyme family protein [bacterium]
MPQRLPGDCSPVLIMFVYFVMVLSPLFATAQSESDKTWVNRLGMEFVLIPSGTFQMGAGNQESDELPLHQVTISRPFYLGKYEVTQGQWKAVMGNNRSFFAGDENLPVESVWWSDVNAFIKKLNKMEGQDTYRLPTEAEWEYAARAGSTSSYSFGNDPQQLKRYAWYKDNSGAKTHPVGQLQPNAWGLFDIHGNVWEWVQDWYGRYTSQAVKDPQGPSMGTHRMRRGGGWNNFAKACRTTNRYSVVGFRDDFIGFRLLRIAK